ncbi:MAG: ParA family protein [Deltaproteobacteria bacterium]|nr:ParA family protein [Deltaproteobacteria bacterium]
MSLLTDKIKELISVEARNGQGRANHQAVLVSICSQKGGVGKTTTSVNLGSALAKFYNKKILVCDLDPQGHVEKAIGSIIPEGVEYSPLSTILTRKKGNLQEAIVQTEIDNLSVTPGDKNLYETESVLASKIGKEFILQEAIKPIRNQYDYILFDCPPNLGNLTLNALVASDYCLVPCEMSVLAFEGVNDLIETLDTVNERLNKSLQLLGVVMTRVDSRNVAMNRVIEENLKNYFKGKIFKSQIAVNTALNKAQLEGIPVFDYAPSCSGSTNYMSLADEFLKKIKKSKSSNGSDEDEVDEVVSA